MAAVQNVGIVGAGAAGLTAAILLADAGIQVEVLEKADAPQTLGSGITLQGNALRVFAPARRLGADRGEGLRVQHPRPARPGPRRHRHRRAG